MSRLVLTNPFLGLLTCRGPTVSVSVGLSSRHEESDSQMSGYNTKKAELERLRTSPSQPVTLGMRTYCGRS